MVGDVDVEEGVAEERKVYAVSTCPSRSTYQFIFQVEEGEEKEEATPLTSTSPCRRRTVTLKMPSRICRGRYIAM